MDKVVTLTAGSDERGEVTLHAMVESSTIKFIYWSNITNRKGSLHITFNTGKRYKYTDVDANVFTMLITAQSIGKKFNEVVRGHYDYELV
jgi:hypothetical protein